jgi:hypothetical protein
VADGRHGCCRNCGRGAGRDSGSEWINRGTGHSWNFTGHNNRNITGYDHTGLYPDPRNDSAWNCKPDPGYGKSDTRNRNTCAGNNSGDSSDKSHTGNHSGSFDSGDKPYHADSGDHSRNDHPGNRASCG